jgi:hypothetical protein
MPPTNRNLTLRWDGTPNPMDKVAYVSAVQNDGYHDLRIEVDIDDCDFASAVAMMQEVINRVNAYATD